MSKKNHRLTKKASERGRQLALELERAGRLTYGQRRRRICDDVGCSASAAERWMAAAKTEVHKEAPDLSPETMEASRHLRMQVYDLRARQYRMTADQRLEAGEFNQAAKMEGTAVHYERLLITIAHWDRLAPEHDLDDPDLRRTILDVLTRKLAAFTTTELLDVHRAVTSELAGRQRRVELAELDLPALEGLASAERIRGDTRARGRSLAAKI